MSSQPPHEPLASSWLFLQTNSPCPSTEITRKLRIPFFAFPSFQKHRKPADEAGPDWSRQARAQKPCISLTGSQVCPRPLPRSQSGTSGCSCRAWSPGGRTGGSPCVPCPCPQSTLCPGRPQAWGKAVGPPPRAEVGSQPAGMAGASSPGGCLLTPLTPPPPLCRHPADSLPPQLPPTPTPCPEVAPPQPPHLSTSTLTARWPPGVLTPHKQGTRPAANQLRPCPLPAEASESPAEPPLVPLIQHAACTPAQVTTGLFLAQAHVGKPEGDSEMPPPPGSPPESPPSDTAHGLASSEAVTGLLHGYLTHLVRERRRLL